MRHDQTRLDEAQIQAALQRAHRLRAEFWLGLVRRAAELIASAGRAQGSQLRPSGRRGHAAAC